MPTPTHTKLPDFITLPFTQAVAIGCIRTAQLTAENRRADRKQATVQTTYRLRDAILKTIPEYVLHSR